MKTLIRDLLLDAALWLEEHEWCQGRSYGVSVDHEPPAAACMYGALALQCEGADRRAPLLDACNAVIDFLGQDIPSWNDAPERTKEDVIAVLRAVALA